MEEHEEYPEFEPETINFWQLINPFSDFWDEKDPDGFFRGSMSLITALVIGGFIFLITKH